MADLAAGARFPAALLKKVQGLEESPTDFAAAGVDYATEQCRELLDNGVAGIHFYTLNKSRATLEITRRLDLA